MLSELGYLPQARTLFVRFRNNGALYAYFGVPPEQVAALRKSPSIGRFMQKHVIRQYYSARISEGEDKRGENQAA